MTALRLGVIGLGKGAHGVLPTIAALPEIELVAATSRDPQVRARFEARFPGARGYPDIPSLCNDPDIDAVWVATPNRFHCDHAIEAMRCGKHVAVDKPMAVTLAEADRMVAAAEKHGVKLLAGFTDSLSLPIRAMRKVAMSGEIGAPKAILIWSYTDWMLRPRTAEELAPESGAGIVHRQVPHQVDTLRLLGGGRLRSVRGTVGQWMPERPAPGFYSAYLEFESGMSASILHNGHGYFMGLELLDPEAAGRWRYTGEDRVAIRRALRTGERDDQSEKGHRDQPGRIATVSAAPRRWSPMDLGMLILSCERGDVRCGEYGPIVYSDTGRREVDLRTLTRGEMELEDGGEAQTMLELHAAVIEGKPIYHSGEWGRATLEVAIALVRSAQERREIMLERQVAMPAEYDEGLQVPAGL